MGEGRGGEEGRDESEENERTTMMKGVESGRSGLDAASPPPPPRTSMVDTTKDGVATPPAAPPVAHPRASRSVTAHLHKRDLLPNFLFFRWPRTELLFSTGDRYHSLCLPVD